MQFYRGKDKWALLRNSRRMAMVHVCRIVGFVGGTRGIGVVRVRRVIIVGCSIFRVAYNSQYETVFDLFIYLFLF